MELVTSRSNPTIKLVRSLLGRRATRYREQLFVAEGLRAILTLIELGVPLKTVLVDAAHAEDVDDDLRSLIDRSDRAIAVDSSLFRSVSDTEAPQPVAAIFHMPTLGIPAESDLVVALDGVRDPGNLGSIIRTSAAAGVDWIALLPGTVDPYNPKVVRSTAGLVGALPLVPVSEIDEIVETMGRNDVSLVLASAAGDVSYDEVDWRGARVLVLGGEAAGIRSETYASSAVVAYIPMARGVESLNVGVAAGVFLFEAARQRRGATRV